jgi:outer membrane immunogenic protein
MTRKTASIAALALVFSAGLASAADLPSRKGPPMLPPPPPPPLWTGFYAGLNAGGTWSENNTINTASWGAFNNGSAGGVEALPVSAALASYSLSVGKNGGFIGGGQIGYNWQFANTFVAGIEADIQGVAASRASSTAVSAGITTINGPLVQFANAARNVDYLGTVRGRLGYLVTPTLLAYATGGVAYGQVTASSSISQQFVVNPIGNVGNPYFSTGGFSDTRVGWTVGGGLEWLFMPNWSAKVEYLYYDLGQITYAMTPLTNIGQTAAVGVFTSVLPQSTTRFNGHVVRAGLNYHFNWGSAPVVAKY